MTYVFRLLPEVEEDAASVYGWYEEKAQRPRGEFLKGQVFNRACCQG
jgi:hypothetical protein